HVGQTFHESLIDLLFGAPGTWAIKKCPQPGCGLLWLDPCPITEDIHLAYEAYYTHGKGGVSARTREILYSLYRFIQSIPARTVGLQRERVDLEFMFLRGKKPGRLLDVGCGSGKFMARMQARGWAVQGVD